MASLFSDNPLPGFDSGWCQMFEDHGHNKLGDVKEITTSPYTGKQLRWSWQVHVCVRRSKRGKWLQLHTK